MSLRGMSSISAASCLDDSVESVLQWMSGIQEEWLIVFDNADDLPIYVVERFIVRATADGGAELAGDPKLNIFRVVITNRSPSRGS